MSLVTSSEPVTSNEAARNAVTRNTAPLTNAERQRLYRERQKLKKAQAQTVAAVTTDAGADKPKRSKRGGHKPGGSERYQEMKRQAEEAERQYAEAEARKPRKPPVPYSDEIANAIIERLEQGEALHAICSEEGMPSHAAVHKWAAEKPDSFGDRYVRARELGYLKWADELDALADGSIEGERRFESGVVQRHRLQIDTRRWILSKMLPKVFGDKLDVTSAGKPLASTSDLDIAKALAHALAAPALAAPVIEGEVVEVTPEDGQ